MSKIPDKALLDDIKRLSDSDYLKFKDYKAKGGKYGAKTFQNHFGTWTKALELAGLDRNRANDYKRTDLKGEKFGLLTIIEEAEYRGKQKQWLCKCECGKTIIASTYDLTSGHTISCGHLRAERMAHASKVKQTTNVYNNVKGNWFNNTLPNTNKTGFLGVQTYKTKSGKIKYRARLIINKKEYSKSGFDTAKEAYQARLDLEEKYLPEEILNKINNK